MTKIDAIKSKVKQLIITGGWMLFLLIVGIGDSFGLDQISKSNPAFEKYSEPRLGISFSKPKGWNVSFGNGVVFIRPGAAHESTNVFICPILQAHPQMKALSFLHFMYSLARVQHPEMQIIDKKNNKDDTLGEISVFFEENQSKIQGVYLVSISQGRGVFCGYEERRDRFDIQKAVLREVIKTLKIMPLDYDKASKNEQTQTGSNSKNLQPTIDIKKLVIKASSDNSMFLAVPPDWVVGGGNFALAATSPDEKMGVLATNDHQPRIWDPYGYFMQCLMPFYRCINTSIQKKEPNYELMQACQSQGLTANAVNFMGETTQFSGQKVYFWIIVNAVALGNGVGFVSTCGFYATPDLFERNSKVLYAIMSSMNPNQGLIMSRLRQNLDGLARASKTMSQTSDIVIQGLRSSSANTDRAIDKYNYYLSGEEARYSPLENRIYVVDSNLSNYAVNPNYPQEILTTVPDQLWNNLPHERIYP
jgi:hypothetical protein